MTSTHVWDYKDVDVDFASGDNGRIDHTDRLRPDSWTGWIHAHMKEYFRIISACTWDDTGYTGGSGYLDGTYTGVELTRVDNGLAGRHCYVDITVSGGAVTALTVTETGNGYINGDVVTLTDTAIINGSGAGFQMTCTGGTGEMGFIWDATKSTNTGAKDVEWMWGMHRNTGTDWRHWQKFTQQNAATAYIYVGTGYSNNGSSNGLGQLDSANKSASTSMWFGAKGSNYKVWVHYDTTAGKEHFAWGDNQYENYQGFFKVDQTGFTPVVNLNSMSQYALFNNYAPYTVTNRTYNEEVCSDSAPTLYIPLDYGVYFSGHTLYCRSVIQGRVPEWLKFTRSVSMSSTPGQLTTSTDGLKQFRRMTDRCVFMEDV